MDRLPANEAKPIDIGSAADGKTFVTPAPQLDCIRRDHDSSRRHDRASLQLRVAQRRLEQLSVAAQCFAVQLDFRKLLGEIAAHAQQILPVDQVVAYSHIDGRLVLEAAYPQPIPTQHPAPDDALWCVKRLKPKVSNAPRASHPEVRNAICVPFVASQNRVLGVLEFCNKRAGGLFTADDAHAALCVARIGTSALDRARLFFRMEEWRQSVETLLSFNATVNQQLEPERMVRELVANVTGFLEADGGMAGILIRSDLEVRVHCDGFYHASTWHEFNRQWRREEGIPGTVLETQFPYLSRDYKADALRDAWLAQRFDLGPCVCVPIKNPKEEVLGFFQLHRRAGEPEFTWQDAAFLESLGGTAAVAIENARLVKSLEL
ncbi:MAG: GAF domain-containing protein, partial [Planctomycetales bacterium]|nr:GAF domain-containing protein [Planctomycetales bacterium]